eukprot:TRINITY_DN15351_c0_g2_i3.p5 TRINITY_DN15351_c0_g2~~TRINITY_DN15351_c0_g2_i3.p5  ORF type:complete len:109 (+),score=1.94 TRINITY_DN15351_c0_g2_i3:422-748(+)
MRPVCACTAKLPCVRLACSARIELHPVLNYENSQALHHALQSSEGVPECASVCPLSPSPLSAHRFPLPAPCSHPSLRPCVCVCVVLQPSAVPHTPPPKRLAVPAARTL